MNFSDKKLSVVVVVVAVVNFLNNHLLSQNYWANFNQTLNNTLGKMLLICSNEGPGLTLVRDNQNVIINNFKDLLIRILPLSL